MAWPATTRTLADCLGNLNGQAIKTKLLLDGMSADSSVGVTERVRYVQLQPRLDSLSRYITECANRPGFAQYARDMFALQGLNTNAELNALNTAAANLVTENNALLALGTNISTEQAAAFRALVSAYALTVA